MAGRGARRLDAVLWTFVPAAGQDESTCDLFVRRVPQTHRCLPSQTLGHGAPRIVFGRGADYSPGELRNCGAKTQRFRAGIDPKEAFCNMLVTNGLDVRSGERSVDRGGRTGGGSDRSRPWRAAMHCDRAICPRPGVGRAPCRDWVDPGIAEPTIGLGAASGLAPAPPRSERRPGSGSPCPF